jgi:hypothetical protein
VGRGSRTRNARCSTVLNRFLTHTYALSCPRARPKRYGWASADSSEGLPPPSIAATPQHVCAPLSRNNFSNDDTPLYTGPRALRRAVPRQRVAHFHYLTPIHRLPPQQRPANRVDYCSRVCQTVSDSARLCQAVPGCARLCQTVPGCARLCQAVPGCARLCQAV